MSPYTLQAILQKNEAKILEDWLREQLSGTNSRKDLMKESDLRAESARLLTHLESALAQDPEPKKTLGPAWKATIDFLGSMSASRALAGFTASETATFVFSLKQPIFTQLQAAAQNSPADLARLYWEATVLLDRLGLITVETFQRSREAVIKRQQEEMLELSTPVVKLWDGVLALPMIGTLDSARTQVVMENLLQRIVETGSEVAILDITGVPHVDTLTAQHLLKTVTAARLMGADCIISGIRPQIAQTIVHLGVDLSEVTTKATLADAFQVALARMGKAVGRAVNRSAETSPLGAPPSRAVAGKASSSPSTPYSQATN